MTERKLRRPGTGGRLLLICAIAWLSGLSLAMASEYHGQVTFGGLPLPGSTVTVTATQGTKTAVAITDSQGFYSFPDLADGKWTIAIAMTGFAPVKQEVTVAPNAAAGAFEMKLLSLEQMRAAAKPVKEAAAPAASASVAVPESTNAATAGTGTAAAGTAAAGTAAAAKKKGAAATTQEAGAAPAAPIAAPEPDANAQQTSDGLLINGSVNNASTSQYSMSQAFGNSRSGKRSLYTGNLLLVLNNSAFNARPYSLTGQSIANPSSGTYNMGVSFGGPLNIPHLMPRGPNFQISYNRVQSSTVSTQPALVPTQAELGGDLSQATNVTTIYIPSDMSTLSSSCNSALLGEGLSQSSINSGTAQFVGNVIPSACISSVAHNLINMNFYPAPNLTGNAQYNYQTTLTNDSHTDSFGTTLSRSIGNKNYVYGGVNFSSTRMGNTNMFGFHDSNNSLNLGVNATWSHRFTQRIWMTTTYNFSRSRSQAIPFFANRVNVEGDAQITNAANNTASNWGPPGLSFTQSTIAGLSDGTSSNNRNETNRLSLDLEWYHQRHDIRIGGDFRRQENNILMQANPDGSLGFNGQATQSSAGAGGYDFADFLLGVPDTSRIAYGNADKYLRQSVYDLYARDDFRVNSEFTVNWGIRWEYGAPVTELKGRLVNLDIAPGFTSEQPVLGSSPVGPLTGQSYPTSLVRPDRSGYAPNIGIAWRPISGSSLLVRAGYQIANDTSVYQATAVAMYQQAPLSTSLSVSNSTTCRFTMANPFSVPCSTTTPDSFAVDPNFRVGYVQIWNLHVQRDLPGSLQLQVSYLGNKGTRGVQEFLPNTAPPGAANPYSANPSGYIYRTSNGNSTREAGSVELRRRLRNGLQAGATYVFSKSLDDVYSLGGQGGVTGGMGLAQNWLDLSSGQRGLSTSDQRHVLSANAQYTTGMGIGGKTLMSGWRGLAYKGWIVSTTIRLASGTPETPIYGGASVPGTGVTGSIRPNVTGVSLYSGLTAGHHLNSAAYSVPSGQWGNARRDSITGPNQFTLNAQMQRSFQLTKRYILSAQIDATNVLNHVAFSSWNNIFIPNSTQFGEPQSPNSMRTMQITMRLRF
jgi:hypothetical protein